MNGVRSARPALSLLTCHRGRRRHLELLLAWMERIRRAEGFVAFELVLVDADDRPDTAHAVDALPWIRYLHSPMQGVFHKTLLLNQALSLAQGRFVMPFDVDLLPNIGVLGRHLRLAEQGPPFLMSGYRVMLQHFPTDNPLPTCADVACHLLSSDGPVIGPEDAPSALRKYLLAGERFGVCPCFPREAVERVGAWDEAYVGWGGEDQDLIERVVRHGLVLVRCYDLLYFHVPHSREAAWNDAELTGRNRDRLRALRQGASIGAKP